MSLHPCQVAAPFQVLNTRAKIAFFFAPFAGTIKRLDFGIDPAHTNSNGDATFDVNVNGVTIFADQTQRPKILSGASLGNKTGLAVAVSVGDLVSFDADIIPLGGLQGPVMMQALIDDGVVTGIEIAEADTAPDVLGVTKLLVGNGDLTDNGGGAARLLTAADAYSAVLAYLLSGGLIKPTLLPSLAVNDVFSVANQAAMLALLAQRGDVAVLADTGRTYILSADAPAVLANWIVIPWPGAVTSLAVGGDLTGTTDNAILALILAAAGSVGSKTLVPVLTYDRKGRITVVATASIVPGGDLGGADITGAVVNQLKGRSIGGIPDVPGFFGDEFSYASGGVLDASLWPKVLVPAGQGGDTISFGGGLMTITEGTVFPAYGRTGRGSPQTNVTGKTITCKIVSMAANSTWSVFFGFIDGSYGGDLNTDPNRAGWERIIGNNLYPQADGSAGTDRGPAIVYDGSYSLWLRCKWNSDNSVALSYSTDGVTFTTRYTVASANVWLNPATARVAFYAGNGNSTGRNMVWDFIESDIPQADPIIGQSLWALLWDNPNNRFGLLRALGCVPTTSGAPAGAPSNVPAGHTLIMYDSTAHIMYAWNGAAWDSQAF